MAGGRVDPDLVASRVAAVRARISGITDRAVSIVAVTKTFGIDAMEAAWRAGCDAVGENYAQELLAKAPGVPAGCPVHFIGRIQSNKVRQIAPIVALWESVDRDRVVDEIARRAPGARVLLQVDTTAEPGKGGCDPGALDGLLARAREAGLVVEGLMTVGPTGGSRDDCARAFSLLRRLADDRGLLECSMGMSEDWETAVAEGSTEVRLGSALFGART